MPEVLAFARALADSGKYFMGTINNESRELNLHRIEKFGLREIFRLFVSSCFVGLRKPESGIYRLAIEITQIQSGRMLFHRRPRAESGMRREAGHAHDSDANAGTVAARVGKAGSESSGRECPVISGQCLTLLATGRRDH